VSEARVNCRLLVTGAPEGSYQNLSNPSAASFTSKFWILDCRFWIGGIASLHHFQEHIAWIPVLFAFQLSAFLHPSIQYQGSRIPETRHLPACRSLV